MKTLYLSDLDGTLLGRDQRLSPYTCAVLTQFVAEGGIFAYATARSLQTASKATAGFAAKHPVIVNNGAMIMDPVSGERLDACSFARAEAEAILHALHGFGVHPLVYTLSEGRERFAYDTAYITPGLQHFLDARTEDPRRRPVSDPAALLEGDPFYFTCIDRDATLAPAYAALRDRYRCLYTRDMYTGNQWLEVLPQAATKAHAALKLKAMLGCDRIVAFGDGNNDRELFAVADEGIAVANADPTLRAMATQVIGPHDEDAVARYLAAQKER